MNRFCRYELRTTHVEAARVFYREVLGDRFWGNGIDAAPLSAQAATRGAPPHWVGHLGVADVIETVHRFLQKGATQLGSAGRTGDRVTHATLRDPFGAVVALTSASLVGEADRVAWHLLSARDETDAFAVYAELFGWTAVEAIDMGQERGRHVTFSWDRTMQTAGSTANIARLPHVHPQWLFFFRTENLEESLARVRALGGLTLPPVMTPEGALVAPCDDPQGAAFGLYQSNGR